MTQSSDNVGKVHDIVLKSLDKIDRITDMLRTDIQTIRGEVQSMAVEMAKAEAIPREMDRITLELRKLDSRVDVVVQEHAASQAVQSRLEKWLPYLLALGLGGNFLHDFVKVSGSESSVIEEKLP